MSTININGKTISVSGNNIVVTNNKCYVDGKLIEENLPAETKIIFEGDIANIECSVIEVKGNVTGDIRTNTIVCGDVKGDIRSNTVKCGKVTGSIKANTVNHE